jgi:integrase
LASHLRAHPSNAACERSGIDDVTFHDLRGTAVTRLAKAGCSVAEIASLTGHALKNAQAILDTHYLGGHLELAEAAMAKLEVCFRLPERPIASCVLLPIASQLLGL